MNDERVVFGPRRPLKILVIAVLTAPIAAGVVFLPTGSDAATDSP
jgi:hypothetical protein